MQGGDDEGGSGGEARRGEDRGEEGDGGRGDGHGVFVWEDSVAIVARNILSVHQNRNRCDDRGHAFRKHLVHDTSQHRR